jgi:hemolysin D
MAFLTNRIANDSVLDSGQHKAEPLLWSVGLQTTLDQPPAALPVRCALAGSVFCLLVVSWAWFGRVDQVAQAKGKLIPQGDVHRVHPLEAGKVMQVMVQEGQAVAAGQVLVELDTDLAAKDVERLQAARAATQDELTQTQLLWEKAQLQAQAKAAIAQSDLNTTRVSIAQTTATAQNKASILTQLRQDVQQQQTRLNRIQALSREGAIAQDTVFGLEQGVRDRQRSITEGEGTWQANLADVERLRVELEQKKAQAVQAQLQAQQEIKTLQVRLTELQAKRDDTQILLAAAQAKLKQRLVYAPAAGTVLSLTVRQSGEVVQPGQAIAEIAPRNQPLVLSAQIPSRDAGFIQPGMPVNIKLDAFPYQDYGIVPGTVLTLSPDSKATAAGEQVYRVEVQLRQSEIQAKGQAIAFRAGQTATAEIVTRQRRIADILLDPVKKLRSGIP